MGIVVIGAVFVDVKGYPEGTYIPGGRNAGSVEYTHGGVGRNVAEDIANVELRPTFVSLVDTTGSGVVVFVVSFCKSVLSRSACSAMPVFLGCNTHVLFEYLRKITTF